MFLVSAKYVFSRREDFHRQTNAPGILIPRLVHRGDSLFHAILLETEESSLKGEGAIERVLSHYAYPFSPLLHRHPFTSVLYRRLSSRNRFGIIALAIQMIISLRDSFAIPYRFPQMSKCVLILDEPLYYLTVEIIGIVSTRT